MTKNKLFRIIKLSLINLFVILLLLVLIDPILGMISDEKEGLSRNINFKENTPNSSLKIGTDETDRNKKPNFKNTDQYGFILGPNETSTNEIDFIFLGSSTVENENVREVNRYPFLSIKNLNQELGTNYISRNAGVGGNLLSASNLILTTKIIPLKPQYVVLSSSLIDMLYLSKNRSYWDGSKKYLIEEKAANSLLKNIKDTFFRNLWLQIRKFRLNNNISDFQKKDFSPEDQERILNQYRRQLEIFINTCLIYNITPILSTDYYVPELVKRNLIKKGIFNSHEANYYVETLIPELNLLINSKAEEYDLSIIKLHEQVEFNKNFVNKEDGIHLTDEGSQKVSKVISNFLLRKIQHEEI